MGTDTPPAVRPVIPEHVQSYLWKLGIAILFALSVMALRQVDRWLGGDGNVVLPAPEIAKEQGPGLLVGGEEPIDYEGCAYEAPNLQAADPDAPQHAEGDGRPWPTQRITYFIDYRNTDKLRPALSRDAIRESFRQAWGWWAERIEIEPVEVGDESQALVRHRFARLDGPTGTLAWSYLSDGTLRPKEQRYDTSERWVAGPPAANQLSLPAVQAHEIGHVLGLGHDDPQAFALMRPSYSASLPREQERDIQRLVGLGYRRREGRTSAQDLLQFPVSARAQDLADALKRSGWTVTPPKQGGK